MEKKFFDPEEAIRIVRRRMRSAILVFGVLMAVGVTALLAIPQSYTATALVMVEPAGKNLLETGASRGDASDSARMDSEVLLVQSPEVLERVAAALELSDREEFYPRTGMLDRLLQAIHLQAPIHYTSDQRSIAATAILGQKILVRRVGATFVISVKANAGDAQLAAEIANTVAKGYVALQVERKIAATNNDRAILTKSLAQASLTLGQRESQLDAFLAGQAARDGANPFEAEVAEATRQRISLAAQRSDIENRLAAADWDGLEQLVASDLFRQLNAQRQSLAAQVNASAPSAKLEGDYKAVFASLRSETEKAAQDLANQTNSAEARLAALRQQMSASVLTPALPAPILTQIYGLQKASELAREQYDRLLSRLNDLETQSSLHIANSTIVAPATLPTEPSTPNRRLGLLALLCFADCASGGWVFYRENHVGGFSSMQQAEAVLGAEVIAQVPFEDRSTGQTSQSLADLVLDEPLSFFSEAIRSMRLGIDRAARRMNRPDGQGRIIMMTSAGPEEGRTSLALALARSYALSGKTCLLIDCDLHRPNLYRHLTFRRLQGISTYLHDETVPLASLVSRDSRSNLHVIAGSQRPIISTDHFVSSKTFARLMEATREIFDIVVLDTPPVLPVVDARYLARHADTIVLVANWASTSQATGKEAVRLLDAEREPGVEILTVLNQVDGAELRRKHLGYYQEGELDFV